MKARYYYGYNIVAAGFIIQGVCIGAMFAYGVFFKELQAEFGWSRAIISGASSLAFLMMGAVGILAGRLNDRIGPRVLFVASAGFLGLGYTAHVPHAIPLAAIRYVWCGGRYRF